MANVNLYTKFDFTDAAGNLYADGSTTVAKLIDVGTNPDIFDRTYYIATPTTPTEIMNDTLMADGFEFLWIESDVMAEIQLVCNEGGSINTDDMELGFLIKLNPGIPFVLSNDDSRNASDVATAGTDNMIQAAWAAEIDDWENRWTADVIDRIEFYSSTGAAATVRVVAIG